MALMMMDWAKGGANALKLKFSNLLLGFWIEFHWYAYDIYVRKILFGEYEIDF